MCERSCGGQRGNSEIASTPAAPRQRASTCPKLYLTGTVSVKEATGGDYARVLGIWQKTVKSSTYLPVISRRRAGHLAQCLVAPLLCDDPVDARLDTASSTQPLERLPCGICAFKAASSAVLWWRVADGLLGGAKDGGDVEGSSGGSQLMRRVRWKVRRVR